MDDNQMNTEESGFTVPSGLEGYGDSSSNPLDGFLPAPDSSSLLEGAQGSRQEGDDAGSRRDKSSRKGVPLTKRVGQLTYKNKLLEEQNHSIRATYEEQMRRLQMENQQFRNELNAKEHESVRYTEDALAQSKAVILNELRRSKEDGDIDSEMKWQDELSSLHHAHAKLEAHKVAARPGEDDFSSEPVPYYSGPRADAGYYPPQAQTPTNPVMQEWLGRNPWADSSHPQYAPTMWQVADQEASDLNNSLRENNRADIIGTPDYFNALDDMINEAMGGGSEDADEGQQTSRSAPSRSAPVASVPRGGITMAEQYLRNNQKVGGSPVRLSENAEMVARNLNLRENGRMLSPEEARARYIKAMNVPLCPGGSQYRFRVTRGV